PLPGPAAGLLAGPPEPPLEDLADVLGVVVEVELPLDQPGDAGGGPEFVVPAVGLRTLRQQARQRPEVGVGQARCRGGWGLGVHPAGPPGRPDPPGHGLVVDAEHLGDGLAGLATGHSLHGLLSAAFQFSSGSKGSAHTRLDGYTTPRDRSACWTEYQMTWVPSTKRWAKNYLGKSYSVSCRQLGCQPTKEASWKKANDWWEQKQAEIDGQHIPLPHPHAELIDLLTRQRG